uniref:Endonuclease/exonuclease/phosphatase domain-containing protein n=1 Tax=Cajanus cajan TaxID=3821 RepID=A0A151R5Q8_CAJCA|nr:hypothetical protein KK1_040902 [Cajanus cajan]
MELEEVPIIGKKYTWYKPNGRVKSRLDKTLVTKECLLEWSSISQKVLKRSVFDHCPILLQ